MEKENKNCATEEYVKLILMCQMEKFCTEECSAS